MSFPTSKCDLRLTLMLVLCRLEDLPPEDEYAELSLDNFMSKM